MYAFHLLRWPLLRFAASVFPFWCLYIYGLFLLFFSLLAVVSFSHMCMCVCCLFAALFWPEMQSHSLILSDHEPEILHIPDLRFMYWCFLAFCFYSILAPRRIFVEQFPKNQDEFLFFYFFFLNDWMFVFFHRNCMRISINSFIQKHENKFTNKKYKLFICFIALIKCTINFLKFSYFISVLLIAWESFVRDNEKSKWNRVRANAHRTL